MTIEEYKTKFRELYEQLMKEHGYVGRVEIWPKVDCFYPNNTEVIRVKIEF